MTFIIDKSSTKFLMGLAQTDQLQQWMAQNPEMIGLCTIGRSNVGKSTLINSLFGKSVAKTSKNPGKTKEINIFSFQLKDLNAKGKSSKSEESQNTFFLFDLPGHGHANVSKAQAKLWGELLTFFFENISPYLLILNIQDCRHPHMPSDQQFLEFISPYNFSSFLIFNKLDKLKTQKEMSALEKIKKNISARYSWINQIHYISAQEGQGLAALNKSLVDQLFLFQSLKEN